MAATTSDEEIEQLAKRIQVLAEKESPRPRLDTLVRAAELLMPVHLDTANRFRDQAIALLKSNPNLKPTAGIVTSLMIVAPETAKDLQGDLDKPEARGKRSASVDDMITRVRAMTPDRSGRELRKMIDQALAAAVAMPMADQRTALSLLLNRAGELKLGREEIDPIAKPFVTAIERTDDDPDDYTWLASLRRQHGTFAGGDNASVRAREAIADLAELVNTDYDFKLKALNGGEQSLKGQRGKVVMVNFWAIWCGPCREEMPLFEQLYKKNKNKGFTILAITDEDPDKVRAYVAKNGYSFPILFDPDRGVFDHYRVRGVPATKIVDKSGRMRAQVNEISEQELKRLLRAAGLRD